MTKDKSTCINPSAKKVTFDGNPWLRFKLDTLNLLISIIMAKI